MPPLNKLMLSSFIGNGIQFLILAFFLCLLGAFGIYYNHKGDLKTVGILIYAFTGIFNGYYASRTYKYLGGKHWAMNLIVSCSLFPVKKNYKLQKILQSFKILTKRYTKKFIYYVIEGESYEQNRNYSKGILLPDTTKLSQ